MKNKFNYLKLKELAEKKTDYKFEFRDGNTVTQQGDLTLTKGSCFPVEVTF